MASIGDENGRKRILFVAPDGKRKTIRLGKVAKRQAEAVKVHVEQLAHAFGTNTAPPLATTQWLASLDSKLYGKLVAVGLAADRNAAAAPTLGKLLDDYIASRRDVKKSTATVWGHTRRCLIRYFGAKKQLGEGTFADATKWRRWLTSSQRLSDSTVRRRCGIARQFFNEAVDARLVAENPFRKLKGIGVQSNRERDHFVTRDDAAKVIDACPDAEWRLIFALSRFGGLRCPSEHLGLRWGDVDFVAGRIRVRSPKTEHHRGKGERTIPMFAELRPYLEDVRELAGERAYDPAEPIIVRYRAGANLRTQWERIIGRAGLTPWPKLFQNLRATRDTELSEAFPIHVVCEWIGNSQAVAQKHYLQVTDAHFEAAKKAAQNPAQQAAEAAGIEQQGAGTEPHIPRGLAANGGMEKISSGRHKTRTCDLYGVNVAL